MSPIVREVMIGPHRLIQGDAYAIRPMLGHVDREVMDPPYLFDNSGGGAYRGARHASDAVVDLGLDQGFDPSIIQMGQTDAVVVFCHNDQLATLLPYLAARFDRVCLCFWRKTNPQPVCNKHYVPELEPYIHAWRRRAHPVGGYHDLKRCWDGPVGRGGPGAHPTIKPLGLMRKIVANAGGTTVLDPFMGTGTTGVAAVLEGRVFIGIEQNPRWFDMACRRVQAAVDGTPDPVREIDLGPERISGTVTGPVVGGGPLFEAWAG